MVNTMEDAIHDKLFKLLSRGIKEEADVVYMLVEIRKLYERRNAKLPPYLALFCDWAVHARLDRPKWAALATTLKDRLIPSEEFRNGLASALKAVDLPEPDNWPTVLQKLAAVLEDCPLEFSEVGPKIKLTVAPYDGEGWAVTSRLSQEPPRKPGFPAQPMR
jgi:hypothetical protein